MPGSVWKSASELLARPAGGANVGLPNMWDAGMQARVFLGVCVFLRVAGAPFSAGAEPVSPAAAARFFETQVQPILQAHCITCHGGEKVRNGLKLTSREALLKGGERGPAISLDKPEESLLLQAVNHQ